MPGHSRRRVRRILQDASAFRHRHGEVLGFRWRHALEKDRHRPGAHLVIRDFAHGKTGNEIGNFLLGQFLTFAFSFDETRDVHVKELSHSYFDACESSVSSRDSSGHGQPEEAWSDGWGSGFPTK